jgi:hypothetical protein
MKPGREERNLFRSAMNQIIEAGVNLAFPLGHHLHCLIAQIPNRLRRASAGWAVADPDAQWRTIRSVLELVREGRGNLKKLHFLLFPESSVPLARFDDVLAAVGSGFRCNTVTMFGVEHVTLRIYRELLERFGADNAEAIAAVDRDIDSGDVLDAPVNWCCVAVKEADGALRVFLEAKTHPFVGEELLDQRGDLYRGRHAYLFRNQPTAFNFMAVVCLDYVYRDLYGSNIRRIVDHANRLFFTTRQTLDALFVLQTNPKPEHRVYRDALSGFYGEYLEDTPGVRDTVTVFGNCSEDSVIGDVVADGSRFGRSAVILGPRHPLPAFRQQEFSTDDFGGAPVSRLRFGTATRLYYVNVPFHHEIDPRSSHVPVKVHAVLRPGAGGGWTPVRQLSAARQPGLAPPARAPRTPARRAASRPPRARRAGPRSRA